jgi:hypothetical protein
MDKALMQHPLGVFATAPAVYVADSYNHSIRLFDPVTGALSTLIGHGARGVKDGALDTAEFNEPNAVLKVGEKLYIADTNNNAIRVADLDAKTVSTLPVTELPPPAVAEFSSQLPNVITLEPIIVKAHAAVTISIILRDGWHVNGDAPSSLALFKMADVSATPKTIASFDREAVKQQRATLPALESGTYRLQGTLYYCEDKAGAICLLKSFDVPIQALSSGVVKITLDLN